MIRLDKETSRKVAVAAKINLAAGRWVISPRNLEPFVVQEMTADGFVPGMGVIVEHRSNECSRNGEKS